MKIVKRIFISIGLLIGLLLVYALITVGLSYIPVNKKANDPDEVTIYLLTNGVHTDIVMPFVNDTRDWSTYLDTQLTTSKLQNPQWVAFGWGDKGFYLETPEWSDLKASVALKAATGLSSAAMHVTYYTTLTEGEDCVKISVSKAHYQKMAQFVFDSFQLKDNKFQPIVTDQNYGDHDVFYEAVGSYSLFYTCNTWANQVLKKGNQKAALFTLLDQGIFYHYN